MRWRMRLDVCTFDRNSQRIGGSMQTVPAPPDCPSWCTIDHENIGPTFHALCTGEVQSQHCSIVDCLWLHRPCFGFPVDLGLSENEATEGGEATMTGSATTDPRRGRDACQARTAAGRHAGDRPNIRSGLGACPRDT